MHIKRNISYMIYLFTLNIYCIYYIIFTIFFHLKSIIIIIIIVNITLNKII